MKVLKEVFKGFSIKKYLLCVLLSIIVSTFIGFTILFVTAVPAYTSVEILNELGQNSKEINEVGNSMQEIYNETKKHFAKEKEMYGEDYPAEGIFLYNITNSYRSYPICKVYTLALVYGIILGTLVYIIFVQKASGVQMLLETIFCGILIILLIILVNLGYNIAINMILNNIGVTDVKYTFSSYVYDIYSSDTSYIFIGIIGIAYIVNLIFQKILVNKLNKKLEKK